MIFIGFFDDQLVDVVQAFVNPIRQTVYRLLNNGFDLAEIHTVLEMVL